jgi:hypothetical protein
VRRQTGVKLDIVLLKKLKILAAQKDSTLAQLIEEAMMNFLKKVKEREK